MRALLNWLNLTTVAGLALAKFSCTELRRTENGVWVAGHYRWRFPVAGAFTLGSVVLVPNRPASYVLNNPRLLAHETRHTTQYALLGWLFLPAYLLANAWSWLRTGDIYSANIFEQHANLADGGYQQKPVRDFKATISDIANRINRLLG